MQRQAIGEEIDDDARSDDSQNSTDYDVWGNANDMAEVAAFMSAASREGRSGGSAGGGAARGGSAVPLWRLAQGVFFLILSMLPIHGFASD